MLKKKLANNKAAIGSWASLTNPTVAEMDSFYIAQGAASTVADSRDAAGQRES